MINLGRFKCSQYDYNFLDYCCNEYKVDIVYFSGCLYVFPSGLDYFDVNVIFNCDSIKCLLAFFKGLNCNKNWLKSLNGYQLTNSIYDKKGR